MRKWLVILAVGLWGGPLWAAVPVTHESVAARTAQIECDYDKQTAYGTGVCLTPGHVLTALHVVTLDGQTCDTPVVHTKEHDWPAKIAATDSQWDLVMLTCDWQPEALEVRAAEPEPLEKAYCFWWDANQHFLSAALSVTTPNLDVPEIHRYRMVGYAGPLNAGCSGTLAFDEATGALLGMINIQHNYSVPQFFGTRASIIMAFLGRDGVH